MKFSRQDAVAGVTTAAVVIPQAMAYATIAGLPVEVGLYTALVPMLAYALVGSSRALSVSTTSTLAALTGAAVGTVAGGDADRAIEAATTLAMLTGVLLLAASVFKLGFVADFISQPVLAGFKARNGAANRGRPARQGAGDRPDRRQLLPEDGLGALAAGRHRLGDGRAGGGDHRAAARAQTLGAGRAGRARGGRRGRRRRRWACSTWR
jgi:hypothetical protein